MQNASREAARVAAHGAGEARPHDAYGAVGDEPRDDTVRASPWHKGAAAVRAKTRFPGGFHVDLLQSLGYNDSVAHIKEG